MADAASSLIAQAPPGVDPAEYARIMREQALAQIEEQYALSPTTVQQPQGGGRFYQAARVSPLSGISRIVSAVMAANGLKSSDKANAQMMAQSLAAFQPGGAAPSQAPAGPPPSSTDGSPVPQSPTAAPSQAAPAAAPPTNPLNPMGQDPRALWRLYMSDPAKYLDMVKGTPEWQTALMANGGNVSATQASLKAKLAKEGVIANRPGEESMIPDQSAPGGYRMIRTPNISPNQDFSRNPDGSIKETHAIPGAAGAQGEMISAETAAREANTPKLVKDVNGNEVWQTPKLAGPASPSGQPAGAGPPSPPQPAPGGPQAPPKDPVVQGPKNYFATGPGSSQTTAGEESQKSGAKGGQEYSADLAKDSQGALDVHRSLAELKNLAKTANPSTANTMKGQVGTMMLGMGMDPQQVSQFLGVDVGSLQAAQKQNAHLAQSSTKMVTSRGTNFDLDTFMKNNPNMGMTPAGFSRVIDFMDKLTQDTMDKQKDFQAFKRTGGPNNTPIPPEEWEAEHTAHWTQIMRDKIKAGGTNSRKPLEEILGPPAVSP